MIDLKFENLHTIQNIKSLCYIFNTNRMLYVNYINKNLKIILSIYHIVVYLKNQDISIIHALNIKLLFSL